MRSHDPDEKSPPFKGNVRHYHRSSRFPERSWDEWIDGESAKGPKRPWLKILGVILAALALVGIIVALLIELR